MLRSAQGSPREQVQDRALALASLPAHHFHLPSHAHWVGPFKNRQGEGKNSVGNVEAKELISMTHGHEL